MLLFYFYSNLLFSKQNLTCTITLFKFISIAEYLQLMYDGTYKFDSELIKQSKTFGGVV